MCTHRMLQISMFSHISQTNVSTANSDLLMEFLHGFKQLGTNKQYTQMIKGYTNLYTSSVMSSLLEQAWALAEPRENVSQ